MKKFFLLFVFTAVLLFASSYHVLLWAQKSDVQEVIERIQKSIEDLKDVSTSVTQKNLIGGINTSFIGTLQFKSPDKFKADIEIDNGLGNKLRSRSIYEGNVLWQEQTDIKSGKINVFKSIMHGTTPQAKEFMRQFNPKEQLKNLMSEYSVISLKNAGDASSPEYVLEMEIKPQVRQRMSQMLKIFSKSTDAGELIPDRAILYWDTKIKYMSELYMYSKNQELTMRTIYTNTKINTGIDDEVFVYNAPEGINIIDMSEIMAEEIVKRELEGVEHELVGSACPEFSLPDIFGENFHSDSLRGKVVIINFWEHWCPPCVKELPEIEDLFQSVFEEEVQIITITSDQEQAMRVVDENGYSFPVLIDSKTELAKKLKVQSIPRTYIVDKAGNIAAVYIGYHPDIKEIITRHLQELNPEEE